MFQNFPRKVSFDPSEVYNISFIFYLKFCVFGFWSRRDLREGSNRREFGGDFMVGMDDLGERWKRDIFERKIVQN